MQVDQGLDLQELAPKTSYLRDYIQASKAQGVYGVENFLYLHIYVRDVDMTDVAVQADVLQLGTDVSNTNTPAFTISYTVVQHAQFVAQY
jgi:hypothetical protein